MDADGSAEERDADWTAASRKATGSAKENVDATATSIETQGSVEEQEADRTKLSTNTDGPAKENVHPTASSSATNGSVKGQADQNATLADPDGPAKQKVDQPMTSTYTPGLHVKTEAAQQMPIQAEAHTNTKVSEGDQTRPPTSSAFHFSADSSAETVNNPFTNRSQVLDAQAARNSASGSVSNTPAESPTTQDESAPVAKTPPTKVCSHCLSEANVKCIQCGSSWYCSKECQRYDWPYHKHLCREYKKFQDRPDPLSVRGILFPEDDNTPRFVWVKQKEEPLDLGCVDEKFEVEELLGVSEVQKIAQQYVMQSIRRDRSSQSTTSRVYLLFRDDCFVDWSKPNKSIATITRGQFEYSWRGPTVAVLTVFDDAAEGNEDEPRADDMTMVDFRDSIDFFHLYGKWHSDYPDFGLSSFWWLPLPLQERLKQEREIQCVKVACDTEHQHTGMKYIPWKISEGHPAMDLLEPLPITGLLGLPLVMRRMPLVEGYEEEARANGNTNWGPSLLLLDINPKNMYWGGALREERVRGNMVLMRQDRKDLHPHHVEAMILYITLLGPAMEESISGQRSRGELVDMLHPSRWDWFFQKLKKERADMESWKNVPPLFEMSSSASVTTLTLAALGLNGHEVGR
ncbi:MAG: hypothetical protein Q9186_004778 [Xanthomendoza sp. 1 TL-2023]